MYQQLVAKLFSFPGRNVTTFTAMQRLDERLGFPHQNFRSVHVGGTNGKGSVATKIAKALQAAGKKVGLYTSPHIVDFRERIQVNGQMIQEDEVEGLLRRLFPLVQEELSFFDLLTAMAFLHFQEQKVDWAVIEVGLGGRLDATNVIHPEIAAITSIGFDHVQILGNTLEAIAREKGGIAKPGVPLIAGPSAAPFYPQAIAVAAEPFYDRENQAVARAVLERLQISETAIVTGLRERPPCRFDIRGPFIFDVAHNPAAFCKLVEALKIHFPDQKFHFVVAFTKEKDFRTCLGQIAPLARRISALRGTANRLILPEQISSDIVNSIRDLIVGQEKIVVCGSFYIMEEQLRELHNLFL